MRLEPLYRATFTTPERWNVALDGEHGTEEQGFLLVEGRTTGRVPARLRAANWPRRRTDGTVLPNFRGALETDDGAVVLYRWQGFGRAAGDGPRELVGSVTHLSDHPRYRWLNDRLCALAGEVQSRPEGGLAVVVDVAELVWEPLSPGS